MAYSQVGPVPPVSSYAKIAAMPVPRRTQPTNPKKNVNVISQRPVDHKQSTSKTSPDDALAKACFGTQRDAEAAIDSIPVPIEKLGLQETAGENPGSEPNADSADSYEEDQSQLSSSSLNKPQSFDTKSLASVTTFAMDDKESIRPDDSASVRAADDENPHAALSRNSSFQQDTEHPSHRSSRVFPSNVTIPGRRFPTMTTLPRFGNLPISPVLESHNVHMPKPTAQIISADEPRPAGPVNIAPPDEKLMDALVSVKDRLPLLQLEDKVLSFLANTTHEVLELPPQNSFTRLLTHKLADYYCLAHSVNEDNTSVRIFRSSNRVLPMPLAHLAKSVPATLPNSTAVKIMRREQLAGRHFSAGNSTAPSSSAPSKATSENGGEGQSDDGLTSPTESTPNRDKSKLTREEREAQYKAARDRIFADFQEALPGEIVPNGEVSASMSRSSSSSGKKKTRRTKQPKDDSFEARSSFIQSWTPAQGQYTSTFMDASMVSNYPGSPVSYDSYNHGTTPTQTYPGFDASMQYQNMQGFNPSLMPQYAANDWQAMQGVQMQNPYFMYPPAMQYPQSPNVMMPGTTPMQSQMPEWYPNQNQPYNNPAYMGQMPAYPQQNTADQRSTSTDHYAQQFQRSYSHQSSSSSHAGSRSNTSLFNPQTRSFVPKNTDARTGNRSNRHKNQVRHSLHSTPSNHTSTSAFSNGQTSREDTLKQKYGTPPSLPKKPPPPSEAKSMSETHTAPSGLELGSPPNGVGPLVANGVGKGTI